jgi:hypothetical protein
MTRKTVFCWVSVTMDVSSMHKVSTIYFYLKGAFLLPPTFRVYISIGKLNFGGAKESFVV